MADSLITNLPPVAELTAPMEFPANVPGAPDTDGKVTGAQVRTFALAPLTLDSSGNLGAINTAAFTPISMPAHQEGLLYYDVDQKGFIAFNGESEVALNIGYENWVDVRNNTGSTITNGQAVYVSGAIGQNPTITLAQANSVSTSRLIGIATHDIENNSNGIVTSFGVVRGLDTSAFTDGALLYLSPTVAGALTATKPTAPNLVVCVGVVLHAHITQGKILVHPEVDSIAATDIYDSSAAGRSMLTAADAAAQTALLNTFTSALKGLVPASGGGTTNFLRADGSFAVPPGAGDVVGPASAVDGQVVLFNLATGKLIKAATASGVAQLSSGVLSTGNVDLTSQVTGTLPVANGGTGITSFGTGVATFLGTPSSANLAAAVTDKTGSGALVFGTSPTLTTPTISGAIAFPDDVRQTFNPGTTTPGLNVGSIAGDPSTPSNGDMWYDSTANELTARINGANVALGAGGGGITGFTATLETASPNNTVNASTLTASGGTTNQDVVLATKGTGAFIGFRVPDNATTGGAKRGNYAVDLQGPLRNNNADIASGVSSCIPGGQYNKATGSYCFAFGYLAASTGGTASMAMGFQANATANYAAVYGGVGCTASGASAFIGGGQSCEATQSYSRAGGFYAKSDRYGVDAWASGLFALSGDSQGVDFVLRCKTTTNAAVEMFLDGSSTRFTIPSGKLVTFFIQLHGIKSDGSAAAVYFRQYAIKNVAGTTSEVFAPVTLGTDTAAGTTVSITANDTNDALNISPTGITSEIWRWTAYVRAVETAYGT